MTAMIVLDASAAVDVILNIGAPARIRARIEAENANDPGGSHVPFIERMWELKENVTAYDAAYITLAETLDAPLITTDGRLSRSCRNTAPPSSFTKFTERNRPPMRFSARQPEHGRGS